jgi:outer membrane receptor protein involved in Fe transport
MQRRIHRSAAALALLHIVSPAIAGPPLAIDDPGILDAWHWELITATTVTSTDSGDYYQAPLIDVSLGVIQDYVQIAAAYPYVHADPDDGGSEWDFGNLEVGLKWRFVNTDRLQVAFAPIYAFGLTRGDAEKGIGEDSDVAFLPLNGEYQINDAWRVNVEVGYASVDDGGDEWSYGAAVALGLNERLELMVELVGATDTDFDDDLLDGRIGFDLAFTEDLHLLFSAATGLRERSGDDELDYDIFLGLQYFP